MVKGLKFAVVSAISYFLALTLTALIHGPI
jgi:hypothetical protein